MHHEGYSISRISGHLEINRRTISNYLFFNEQEYTVFLIASQNGIKFFILMRASQKNAWSLTEIPLLHSWMTYWRSINPISFSLSNKVITRGGKKARNRKIHEIESLTTWLTGANKMYFCPILWYRKLSNLIIPYRIAVLCDFVYWGQIGDKKTISLMIRNYKNINPGGRGGQKYLLSYTLMILYHFMPHLRLWSN